MTSQTTDIVYPPIVANQSPDQAPATSTLDNTCFDFSMLFTLLAFTIVNILSFFTVKYGSVLFILTVIVCAVVWYMELVCTYGIKPRIQNLYQVYSRIWACIFCGELVLSTILSICWVFNIISGITAWTILAFCWVPITTYIFIVGIVESVCEIKKIVPPQTSTTPV